MDNNQLLSNICSLVGGLLLYSIARDIIPAIVRIIINAVSRFKARKQIDENLARIKEVMPNDETEISGKDD